MSHSTFQAAIPSSLQALLGLDMMSEVERNDYLRSVELLIIEAALLRYLPSIASEEQSVFTSWLQAHQGKPSLWSEVLQTFPDFALILQEEINRFLRLDPTQVRMVQ